MKQIDPIDRLLAESQARMDKITNDAKAQALEEFEQWQLQSVARAIPYVLATLAAIFLGLAVGMGAANAQTKDDQILRQLQVLKQQNQQLLDQQKASDMRLDRLREQQRNQIRQDWSDRTRARQQRSLDRARRLRGW